MSVAAVFIAILSALGALIWVYLVSARGGFWRCAVRDTALPLAHDREKCERFSDEIMRQTKDIERDPISPKSDHALGAIESRREWPAVAAVVPARNEADVIGECLGALLRQDYPGPFSVVLVDDQSNDETARLARETAARRRTRPTHGRRGPRCAAGWVGKLWAVKQGLDHVERSGGAPEYLLFTDADIVHSAARACAVSPPQPPTGKSSSFR